MFPFSALSRPLRMYQIGRSRLKRPSPSRETPFQPNRYETAFANLILACTSAWALGTTGCFSRQPPIPMAAVTFYMLLLLAVVGVGRYGNPQYGEALRASYDTMIFLCILVGTPCYAAQFGAMYNVAGKFPNIVVALALYLSIWHILGKFYSSKRRGKSYESDWLMSVGVKSVVFVSVAFVLVLCYQHLNYFGCASAIAFSFCFFFTGTTGTVYNLPAIDLFLYQMSFFNVYSALALKD
ncbi:hypothetical protein ONE63_010446 [Megalurothrips usitatus]|uniref:Uncharacterized protein n=1 Tax=Megalurothrips usitatus TaxID=439358 RepID=A0AAV7XJH0_9NEOP|nr:hypothetical protein ONE63_010446 [Megalurothrips usitatus]